MSFLLPNEPCVQYPEEQSRLTERYIEPHKTALFALFSMLRASVDMALKARQPTKLGKNYPLGQCLEISNEVQHVLSELQENALSGEVLQGFLALQSFLNAGGELRQVWGDLRGQYFQNAFVLGTWYLDVANDTVNLDKPPVELLPFAESGLRPIQNYAHFAAIARQYWGAVSLPNIIFPELAPYFPLIVLPPNGAPQLQGVFDYMMALTCQSEFRMSEQAIAALSIPERLFSVLLEHRLEQVESFDTIESARSKALLACQKAREDGLHLDAGHRNNAIQQALRINQHWQGFVIQWG